LKSLLDELVNFGIFEKLDERIEYYLSKDTIEYFYQAIIQSLEEEFGKILVKRVLSLIAISEKGMSENELITISKTKPLYWSQFYHLFAPHLVTKNGLLTFSHEYVRNAIETRYTKNTKWLKTCRKEIIVYFENEKTNRSYEELAFQYYNLKEYSPLYQLLLSIPAFTYLYDFQKYDLTLYWNTLMGKGYKIGALRETMHSLDQKRKDLYIDVIYFAISELSLYHFAQLLCYDYKTYLDSINDNNSQEYAMLCNCLGNAYYYQSKFRKALLYHEKALEIQKSILGPSHSDIADTHLNIGRVNYRLGNFQMALLNYNDALKIYEEDQDNYLLDMANTYNNIGVVYKDLANYPLSLKYYRKTMEIREKYLGNDYPDTAGSYYNIGIMYCEQGIFSKAQDYCDKALRIQEKLLGVKHIDTTNTYICLGNIHFYQNDNDLALKYYKRALKIQEVILGKDHSITATTYNNIGSLYYNLGNYTMALSYYMKALKIRKKVMSSEHSDTAASLNNIGNVYYRLRNYPMALKYYSKSAKIRESLLGKEHHDTLTSYYYIADVYYEMSNYPLALDYYKMVAIRNYESAYNDLACVYQLMEEYDKALPWAEKAVEAVPQDPNIIDTLATIYQDLGRYDETLEQFELCLKLYKEKENSEGINRTETKIAELKELMK
jgi:preprotein translocase subunit SecA/nephrocystin-3